MKKWKKTNANYFPLEQFVYSTIIEGILNTKHVSSPLWGDVDDAFDTYTKSWNQQLFSVSADKDTSK